MENTNGRVLTFTASQADEGRRVRDILKKEWGLVHHDIARAKYSGGITVDGKNVYASHELRAGETLRVFIYETKSKTTVPTRGALEILYEDGDLLAVNKPAGIVTHPSHGHYVDSLANYAAFHFQEEGEEHEIRTVGRLDKDTSGIVIFAKNRTAAAALTRQAESGERLKTYLALASGTFTETDGTIDEPIGRAEEPDGTGNRRDAQLPVPAVKSGMPSAESVPLLHPRESTKRCVRPDGDRAVTHWHLEKQYSGCALLSVTIDTGRTHQIRVHMAYIGHPLLGDALYGGEISGQELYGRKLPVLHRAALHAWKASFLQPFTGERISIEAPVPPDMQSVGR